ncbi:MAG: PEP-CTERM sorting domain-containing protein, partial [Pirellulales bacterium]
MTLTRPDTFSSPTNPFFPNTLLVVFSTFLACQSMLPLVSADVIIDIEETGGNVVASVTGSIDLNAFRFIETDSAGNAFLEPQFANIDLIASPELESNYTDIAAGSPGATWGFSPFPEYPNSAVGPGFGFDAETMSVYVPEGYVSGDSLSGSATWLGKAFTSLGLNTGTYTYAYGAGTHSGTITVDIGHGSAVPEPSSLMICGGLGLMAFGFRKRLKKG